MGNARYDDSAYQRSTQSFAHQTQAQVFASRGLKESLDPSKFQIRECVASAANPHPTPIILATDVTGSMGVLAETIVRKGLGEIMQRIYDTKPVSDPQVMCAAIGDMRCDSAPIQATQFEASGTALVEQIKEIYLEAGGGGNGGESYFLAWALACAKVKSSELDAGRKGYLFTMGDECVHPDADKAVLRALLGAPDLKLVDTMSVARQLYQRATQRWHVFHLIVNPVPYQPVLPAWKELLVERAILVKDPAHLATGICAIIEHLEGVAGQWDGDNALVARDVQSQLAPR